MAHAMGKKDCGIFGTPPEPFFNMKPIGMSADLLEEWLIVLANENQQNMSNATHKQVCIYLYWRRKTWNY